MNYGLTVCWLQIPASLSHIYTGSEPRLTGILSMESRDDGTTCTITCKREVRHQYLPGTACGKLPDLADQMQHMFWPSHAPLAATRRSLADASQIRASVHQRSGLKQPSARSARRQSLMTKLIRPTNLPFPAAVLAELLLIVLDEVRRS